nr:CehA/McbA family metallohydrolase [uncultured Cohaesibacter sp.]
MLDPFLAPGQFWRGNLHGHSNRSDARLTPEEACATYRENGYDFTTLSDHFRPNYDYPITDSRPFRQEGFTTLIGAELHAPQTSRGVDWHILAVGLPFDFARPADDETGAELARRASLAGAFVAVAHPHWYQLQLEDALTIDVADAVEIYNHTSQVNCDRGYGLEFYDTMLSRGERLNAIAVDDSHFKADDSLGGWVMVKAAENEPDALLKALKAGHFYSTQGPEIYDISRDGDELVFSCSAAQSIMLLGQVSENTRVHGTDLTEARLSLRKFKGSWCRAVIVDAAGKRAWTNPLWLDD